MLEYKVGQLVRKVQHPSWPGVKEDRLIPLNSVGMVNMLETACEFGLGVSVVFPKLGAIACQYGTVVPIEDDGRKKVSWYDCWWYPNQDFIKRFDLDFTKGKAV